MQTAETECFNGTTRNKDNIQKNRNSLYWHGQTVTICIKLKEQDHVIFMTYSDKLFQVKW